MWRKGGHAEGRNRMSHDHIRFRTWQRGVVIRKRGRKTQLYSAHDVHINEVVEVYRFGTTYFRYIEKMSRLEAFQQQLLHHISDSIVGGSTFDNSLEITKISKATESWLTFRSEAYLPKCYVHQSEKLGGETDVHCCNSLR